MGRLDGASVVVTGAGSGLGRAIVERFTAEGASVVAFDKSQAKLASLQGGSGGATATITGDVRSYADNERACALAVDLDRGLDELFAVNVKAYLLGAKKAALPALSAAGGGSIIFTLSNAALYPAGGGPLYVASKHAGAGLVRQLAYELAPAIRVNGVAPGGMATDYTGAFVLLAAQQESRTVTGAVFDLSSFAIPPRGRG